MATASAASKVEHYEISSYRGFIVAAQATGQTEVARSLQENLQQEEQIEQHMPILIQQAMGSTTA